MFSTIDVMVAQAHIDQLNELADAEAFRTKADRHEGEFQHTGIPQVRRRGLRTLSSTTTLPSYGRAFWRLPAATGRVHRADPLTLLRLRHRQQLVHFIDIGHFPALSRLREPETRDCSTSNNPPQLRPATAGRLPRPLRCIPWQLKALVLPFAAGISQETQQWRPTSFAYTHAHAQRGNKNRTITLLLTAHAASPSHTVKISQKYFDNHHGSNEGTPKHSSGAISVIKKTRRSDRATPFGEVTKETLLGERQK